MNDLMITKELTGLDESKARQIEAVFKPMVEMLKGFEATYDVIAALDISPDKCTKAKRLRLDIAQVRIKADKVREEQKAEYLRAGNAIQGVYNILKFAVVDKEEKLKDIETHYERIEAEKKIRLSSERQAELSKYDIDGEFIDLGSMSDSVWTNYFAGVKANYEAIIAAEKKAEEERIEAERKEAEEREKMRLENERLKKEAIIAERAQQAEQKKQEAKLKAEREKAEKERAEAEAEKRIQNEVIRKEREAKEKLEKELADKKAAEERAFLEAEQKASEEATRILAEKEKARQATDKDKLNIIIASLLSDLDNVTSGAAKTAVQTAIDIIRRAADKM